MYDTQEIKKNQPQTKTIIGIKKRAGGAAKETWREKCQSLYANAEEGRVHNTFKKNMKSNLQSVKEFKSKNLSVIGYSSWNNLTR